MKKAISMVFTLALIIALFTGLALPADALEIIIGPIEYPIGEPDSDLSWNLADDGTLTISGTGNMLHSNSSRNMPWSDTPETIRRLVVEEGVTSISGYGFFRCCNLESVQLPASIQKIECYAFSECSSLRSFTVPKNCTEFGVGPFTLCHSLNTINIAPGNHSFVMKDGCLYTSDMTKLITTEADLTGTFKVPGTVDQNYMNYALTNLCHIDKIVFPAFVNITAYRLRGCKALTEIAVSGSGDYSVEDGVLYSADGRELLAYPCGKTGPFVIPQRVTKIAAGAFANCQKLETLNVPKTVTYVGDGAFKFSPSLREVVIQAELREILPSTFKGDTALTRVVLPETLVRIKNDAFYKCTALSEILFPAGLEEIGEWAFQYCTSLKQLFFPESLTTLDTCAFYGCPQLKAVHFLGDVPYTPCCAPFNPEECRQVHAHGWEIDQFRGIPVVECDYTQQEDGTYCSVCGAKTSLPVTDGHSFSRWTLTTDGILYERICSKCGLRETMDGHRPIPAATVSNNRNDQNYSTWTSPIRSNLVCNEDGRFTRVEYTGKQLVCEDYSAEGSFLSGKTLPMELPIYGGFLGGKNYNFVVYGDENPEDLNSREVVRVVRYTKDWKRIDSCSVFGANTSDPFCAGSLRMLEVGDELYIATCHSMYRIGMVHHQANLIFHIHIPDMSMAESRYRISSTRCGYVSHSFNQFIARSGNNILTLEQEEGGDEERAALLLVQAGSESYPGLAKQTKSIRAYDFAPGEGNDTGASLGAFCALPGGNLLTVGCAVPSDSTDLSAQRNIFVSCIPGVDASQEDVRVHLLTEYAPDADIRISTPHAMALPDGSGLAVLWTENGALKYTFTDKEGKRLDKIRTSDAAVSDCAPVLFGDHYYWYVTDNSAPVFYSMEAKPGGRIIALNEPGKPVDPKPGETTEPVEPGTGEPSDPAKPEGKPVFRDVSENFYYAEPIAWAWKNGIANGTDIGLFSPDNTCTRAQAVTFLWRLGGCREPWENRTSFVDVKPGSYYEKAVAWAEECFIVRGMGNRRFCPDEKVTRAQFLTFLWRFEAQPAPEEDRDLHFSDAVPGSYYEDAVIWAVYTGIAKGVTSTTFEPDSFCTRGQAVTFLYRAEQSG